MPHRIDGFDLTFTARTSWKAKLCKHGKLIEIVPVAWTKGWRQTSEGPFQVVSFQNRDELEKINASSKSFVVAIVKAKDYTQDPLQFQEFVRVLRVVPTGKILSQHTIDCRVISAGKDIYEKVEE